jgi:shikimate kinase
MTGPVLILIGPPGAGKSTVGPLLAGLLGAEFLDTDTAVEEVAGKPVGDIFISDGEAAFRELERAAVARTIASHRGILALGGGAVMDPGTRQLLAGQRVVYLETGFRAAAHRTGLDAPRPLLIGNPRARMRELLEERLPVYEALAWVRVGTDDRAPQEIADEIAATVTAEIAAETGEGAGTAPGWPPDGPGSQAQASGGPLEAPGGPAETPGRPLEVPGARWEAPGGPPEAPGGPPERDR